MNSRSVWSTSQLPGQPGLHRDRDHSQSKTKSETQTLNIVLTTSTSIWILLTETLKPPDCVVEITMLRALAVTRQALALGDQEVGGEIPALCCHPILHRTVAFGLALP